MVVNQFVTRRHHVAVHFNKYHPDLTVRSCILPSLPSQSRSISNYRNGQATGEKSCGDEFAENLGWPNALVF
jgi:hypothetical protein